MVLAFVLAGSIITVAVLLFAQTSFNVGSEHLRHNRSIARERDALEYLIATIRTDLAKGVQGDTRTATVAGVTATCVGQTGSGQTSGAGRTDREIVCTTPSITARYRIFDRSGAQPGIIVETLSYRTKG